MKSHLSAKQSLIALELMVAWLFFVLTATVTISSTLTLADTSVLGFLYATRSPLLFQFFSFATILGNTTSIIIASLGIGALLFLAKQWRLALGLAIATIGASSTEVLMKLLIARARPSGFSELLPSSFSYPSGHATASMALYGFITFVLLMRYPKWRTPILIVGGLVVASIGASRLYLGVHYPSDMLGGYLLGALWIFIAAHVVGAMKNR